MQKANNMKSETGTRADLDLVRDAKEGDVVAFEELVRRRTRMTFHIALHITSRMVAASIFSYSKPLNFAITKTTDQVIVHHPDRLHMGVNNRRTDEEESSMLEVLAEGIGFG